MQQPALLKLSRETSFLRYLSDALPCREKRERLAQAYVFQESAAASVQVRCQATAFLLTQKFSNLT